MHTKSNLNIFTLDLLLQNQSKVREHMSLEVEGDHKSVIEHLDDFFCIKKGYLICKHLVPFAIASLLLLTFSISSDNLLIKLVNLLQQPSLLWVPALLLTIVSIIIYVYTINAQIRQMYLWSKGDLQRTVGTSFAYIIICTLITHAVLLSVLSNEISFGSIWASFLLAILSLTGIGWSGPSSWVESVGIKSPDYTDGRLVAVKLTNILRNVRSKSIGSEQDIKDFLEAVMNLRCNIEKNLEIEPDWAKDDLQRVSYLLGTLVEQVRKQFPNDNISAVENFADACKYKIEFPLYIEFVTVLKTLSNYWCEWQFSEVN